MGIPLSTETKTLLDGPNYAHLATLMPDGSPQVSAVWVAREGDRVLLGISEHSLKGKNTRRDSRVALSILDFNDPYTEAQIRGRVVERRPDRDLVGKDAMSRKYLGTEFPRRDPGGRVILVIEVDRARYTKLPFKHAPA